MELSFGPFLTCLTTSMIMTLYFYFLLYQKDTFSAHGKRFMLIGIILILLRMVIPLNFPFTYSIYSEHVLPALIGFLYNKIPIKGFQVIDIFYLIICIGAIIQLIRLLLHKIQLNSYIKEFLIEDTPEHHHLYETISGYTKNSVQVALLPDTISPAITGLRTPTLLLPNISFTASELEYVIKHELMHYKKHDLWITLLVDIVCCIHWWNPLIYLFKKEYTLFMEVANDQAILQSCNCEEQMKYAELILSTARVAHYKQQSQHALSMNFVGKSPSNLRTRVKFITNNSVSPKYKRIVSILQSTFITVLLLFSFVVVAEAYYSVPDKELGEDVFSITEETAYFIHKKNTKTYDLYIKGKYTVTLDHLPDELINVPIKEK